ncbi:MAG: DUF4013 domain-containing protein [Pleurocapsa minor GSE-CHR-MK-17-07R]|jgi:hypothetical protein|nr:DUF4013 domain-containing protein [Pleurocapsa minor GSE-CHR-MK 17-07R]
MNISALLNSIFNDREYLTKLGIAAGVTLLAALLSPVLVGLAGWAILLGWQADLVRHVRRRDKYPLPRWNNIRRFLTPGANILVAYVIYNVPNILLGCGWAFVLSVSGGTQFVGNTITIVSACCLLPLIMIYNLFMVPVFAIGLARFGDDPRISTFFEFGVLYEALTTHFGQTLLFVGMMLAANIVLGLLLIVPVLGWVLYAALIAPVTGILQGQYGLLVLGSSRAKPAAKPLA